LFLYLLFISPSIDVFFNSSFPLCLPSPPPFSLRSPPFLSELWGKFGTRRKNLKKRIEEVKKYWKEKGRGGKTKKGLACREEKEIKKAEKSVKGEG
jgi:hypothetical protein